MKRLLSMALIQVLVLAGCQTTSQQRGTASNHPALRTAVTAAELQAISAGGNLYDALPRLHWHYRGQLTVYVDGMYFGGVESLRSIQVAHVACMRLMSETETTQLYGAQPAPAGSGLDIRTRLACDGSPKGTGDS